MGGCSGLALVWAPTVSRPLGDGLWGGTLVLLYCMAAVQRQHG